MNHADLERRYPDIPWRTPLPVQAPSTRKFVCRYCLAAFGLDAKRLAVTDFAFDGIGDCQSHLANNHPETPGGERVQ